MNEPEPVYFQALITPAAGSDFRRPTFLQNWELPELLTALAGYEPGEVVQVIITPMLPADLRPQVTV